MIVDFHREYLRIRYDSIQSIMTSYTYSTTRLYLTIFYFDDLVVHLNPSNSITATFLFLVDDGGR
jgi:hypothetical protein